MSEDPTPDVTRWEGGAPSTPPPPLHPDATLFEDGASAGDDSRTHQDPSTPPTSSAAEADVTRWEGANDAGIRTCDADATHFEDGAGATDVGPAAELSTVGDSTARDAELTYASTVQPPTPPAANATLWSEDGPSPGAYATRPIPQPGAEVGP
jgi:hypothetical protein